MPFSAACQLWLCLLAGSEQHRVGKTAMGAQSTLPKHLSRAALSHECQQASCELSVTTLNLVGEISAEQSYYFYRYLLSPKPDIYMIWGVLEMQKCTISKPQIQQRKKFSGRSQKKKKRCWANFHIHLPEDLLELLEVNPVLCILFKCESSCRQTAWELLRMVSNMICLLSRKEKTLLSSLCCAWKPSFKD